jgi:two-component system sensor histidine kinase CpxA
MRSLFLKIFLWFWVAMAMVVLASSLTAMMVYDRGAKGFVGGQMAIYGLTAAEKFEQGGKAAADEYLSMVERNTRMRAHLFDDQGNELAGRELTAATGEMARALVASGEEKFEQTARTDFLAKWISLPSGKRFVIASESGRPTGIRLPFMPGVWWAQLIAVLLTTGLLCYLLARYLSFPIVKLRAATQQLAEGNLAARVGAANHRRRDELADLGRDFDVMAERLQVLMSSQQRLLHDISHELRSPLTRQKIALELAREGDGAETRWALERIEREADRLSDLINQLLTLARLESHSSRTIVDTVDLKLLLEEIIFDADFEAQNHQRSVRIVKSEDCLLTGNRQLLHSAIENVVRNAILYTAVGTEVEVSLACANDGETPQAVISVRDQGAGVPQAALADIFRPFYRVADARDRQSGGIGLGLSISQRAVEVHGGSVSAANAPTGGLFVQIRLPLQASEQ